MRFPVQVTFRRMQPSSAVEDWVRAEAEKLETFYDRIIGCRVAIEVPHRHHRTGKPLHVRIDLSLPGKEIVVKREPAAIHRPAITSNTPTKNLSRRGTRRADLEFVIHDAFKAAGRRVQDFARRARGDVKRNGRELVLTRA